MNNISLKENFKTWENIHQIKAVKEVFKNRDIYNFDYIGIDAVDTIKKCILYSADNKGLLNELKIVEYNNNYLMDNRQKIKVSLLKHLTIVKNYVYMIEYKKERYYYNTKDYKSITKELKD